MKPLIVLIIAFLLSVCSLRIAFNDWDYLLSGNIAMCVMLCFTALGHFKFASGMAMMLPQFIPFKKGLVFITGITEIILGIALLYEPYRYIAGILLVVLFILILPANINAAFKHVDFEKATYSGKGRAYLWFRVPLQIFLVVWVLYFAIY